MTRFAHHLQQQTINNPFPGIVRLEAALGHPVTARLGSNECAPQDDSPLARLGGQLAELARLYPDPYAHALRELAAAGNGVRAANVVFDTGADSLILLALRLFCSVGDTVVTSAGSYPTFNYFAQGQGLHVVEVPYASGGDRLAPDLAALADAVRRYGARLVYLANPDNPSGHYWSADAVQSFKSALPADCVLLLDEAYVDFCVDVADAPPPGVLDGVIRLRTLSKAYALAGLRVGYAIAAEDVVDKADQIRPQFALSSVAQLAAQAVLEDRAFSTRLVADTVALRERLAAALTARGACVLPSRTNFVALCYASADEALTRQRALLQQGIAVHRPPHPAMQRLLRLTAQQQALDEAVLAALTA